MWETSCSLVLSQVPQSWLNFSMGWVREYLVLTVKHFPQWWMLSVGQMSANCPIQWEFHLSLLAEDTGRPICARKQTSMFKLLLLVLMKPFLKGTSWAAAFKEQWRNLSEWLGLRAWCTKCCSRLSMPYVLTALCSDVPSAVRTIWAQFRLWPFSSLPPCRCQVIQSWGHLHCAHTVLRALWQ